MHPFVDVQPGEEVSQKNHEIEPSLRGMGSSALGDDAGAPIRAGGASPLRCSDRRRRELGLESRRRRSPARSDRRRGYLDRPTRSLSLGTPAAGSWPPSIVPSPPSEPPRHWAKSVTDVPGSKCYLCIGTFNPMEEREDRGAGCSPDWPWTSAPAYSVRDRPIAPR